MDALATAHEVATLNGVPWECRYKPTWLCLKQLDKRRCVVVERDPKHTLGSGLARLSEAWLNGEKIYDPADDYKVGQIVRLEGEP